MIDAGIVETVSAESVHFASADDWTGLKANLPSQIRLFEIDAAIDSREQLFRALGKALHFPAHFGANWDAVDELLREPDIISHEGVLLIVRHAEHLWTKHPRLAASLIESWLGAAEEWREDRVPFHLLFIW